MKKIAHAFTMAWGMFCIIPCPFRKWDEKARDWMLVFFPVIGLLLGALWMLLGRLPSSALTAAVLTAFPFLFSGFLHLDGFMDCCDAIFSRRDAETKRKILKDSRVGAFAVVGVVLLVLLQFAAFLQCGDRRALLLLPVCSRCAAGFAVTAITPMEGSQYAGSFAESKKTAPTAILLLMLAAVLAIGWFLPDGAALCLGVCALITVSAASFAGRQLGGMSGDVSGFALTLGELAGVICLALLP